MPQNFITYHGCDMHCYKDGTRRQVVYHCSKPSLFPYWKNPRDATNCIANSTRSQLKIKPLATFDDINQYRHEQTWKVSTANYYIPSTGSTDSTGDTLTIVEPKQEQITNNT